MLHSEDGIIPSGKTTPGGGIMLSEGSLLTAEGDMRHLRRVA